MQRAFTNDHLKAPNQRLIEVFMAKMRSDAQFVPTAPTMPSLEIRKLRARLMLEEVMETIENGLGLSVSLLGTNVEPSPDGTVWPSVLNVENIKIEEIHPGSLIEIADGCADVEVVTTGTASACGIAHQSIFDPVMCNNLMKFAPGHSFRADGKLVKPKDHPPVSNAILNELMTQGFNPQV